MSTIKHEFASPGWFNALHAILVQAIDSTEGTEDMEWSTCEVFTNLPRHLPQGRDGSVAWYYSLSKGQFEFGFGEREDVQFRAELDYETAREMARFQTNGDPEKEAAMEQMAVSALTSGKASVHGSRENRPETLPNFHDALASITR